MIMSLVSVRYGQPQAVPALAHRLTLLSPSSSPLAQNLFKKAFFQDFIPIVAAPTQWLSPWSSCASCLSTDLFLNSLNCPNIICHIFLTIQLLLRGNSLLVSVKVLQKKYCLLQDAALLPSNTHYAVEHCKRLAAK